MPSLNTYTASRYLVPLREGGSLPAVMEMEGGEMFVVKFRGAGQGAKSLIAELIVGQIGQAIGLPVPDLALIHLDEPLARTEPDPEIQDILVGSVGVNVGLRYLEKAFMFDPLAIQDLDPRLVASTVWLDALTTNVDRTHRNPNILYREDGLWLIDHGAALYFHHNWAGVTPETMASRFQPIRDHILLRSLTDAGLFREVDAANTALLTSDVLESIVQTVPAELLLDAPAGSTAAFSTAEEGRAAYLEYFVRRLAGEHAFVDEALSAATTVQSQPLTMQGYRR